MFLNVSFEDVKVILRDMGSILKWSAVLYVAPITASIVFMENASIIAKYGLVGVFSFFLGIVLKKFFKTEKETDFKHALPGVGVVWLVFCAISAFPFVLIQGMSFIDSYFESMSALTTTGLTVISVNQIENLPKSLIFWRSILSWVGGIGIVVIAFAGILSTYTRSAKLMTAEGREERLRPNIKNTAREMWFIYVLLTLLGVFLIYFSSEQMSLFDSVNYSMSAISTTGMDSRAGGLITINNPWLDLSLIIVMLFGATSFSVFYLFIKKKQFNAFNADIEFKVLLLLSFFSSLIIFPKMFLFYGNTALGLEHSIFHSVSALTAGGFSLVPLSDIIQWDDFIKIVLVGVMFIGGSAGSTAGGIKISRFIIFVKSIFWRIKKSMLPRKTFFPRKFENRPLEDSELKEVHQFILLYALFVLIGSLFLTLEGNDLGNSVFEVTSAQSNVGISTGITHQGMPLLSQTILIFNMWIGRLEIIPVLSILGYVLARRR